jgi:hypothetical protein
MITNGYIGNSLSLSGASSAYLIFHCTLQKEEGEERVSSPSSWKRTSPTS